MGFRNVFVICLSALSFGLSHNYSFLYMVGTTITGLLWAYTYILSQQRQESPFINLCLIHATTNLIVVMLQA